MNVPLNLKKKKSHHVSETSQQQQQLIALSIPSLFLTGATSSYTVRVEHRQAHKSHSFLQNKTWIWLYVTPKQKQEKLLSYVAYFTPGRNTKMQQYNVFIMFCPKRIHAALTINVCNTGMYPRNTTVFNFSILWVMRQLNLGEFYSYLLAWCVFVQSQPAFFVVSLHVCYILCVSCYATGCTEGHDCSNTHVRGVCSAPYSTPYHMSPVQKTLAQSICYITLPRSVLGTLLSPMNLLILFTLLFAFVSLHAYVRSIICPLSYFYSHK